MGILLQTSLSENKILHQRVEELQNEIIQLSEIISEIRDLGNVTVHNNRSLAAEAERSEQVREDTNG